MKANEFTSMSKEQLTEKVAELKITAVKRDIARAKTVLRQLEQA